MPKKKRQRKGDFTARDIATLLKERNEDLEYTPVDWSIFAQITTMFVDEIVERAIDSFPTEYDKEKVGAYLMGICKRVSVSHSNVSNKPEQLALPTKELEC